MIRITSVKSSIGIITHQGHISKVNANAHSGSESHSSLLERLVTLKTSIPNHPGWWQEAIPWNTMAHMAWLAHFGLDFHEINEPYISSPMLQPAFEFFNRQVTSKRLEYAR